MSGDPRPDPLQTARALVAERFPTATSAWLAGSAVEGRATSTSDLDLTLVDPAEPAPYRLSLEYAGWPVELFVHTAASVRHYVAKDRAAGRPTMARLVSSGVAILEDEAGATLRAECAAVVAAGPPSDPAALDLRRYQLTDLLDDLRGGGTREVMGAVAVAVWQASAELLLVSAGRWRGSGKWLVRELEALDAEAATTYAVDLHDGLSAALDGEVHLLVTVAERALSAAGGLLWVGYRAGGSLDGDNGDT